MLKKILAAYLVILVTALTASGFLISTFLRDQMIDSIRDGLKNNLYALSTVYHNSAQNDSQRLNDMVLKHAEGIKARITIIAGDGKVIADSDSAPSKMNNHNSRPEVHSARIQGQGSNIRYSDTLKYDMLYVASVIDKNKPQSEVLRLGVPLTQVQKTLFLLYQTVILVLLAAGLTAGVCGFLIIRREMSPLQEMSAVTAAIGQGDFTRRAPPGLSGEVGLLSNAINRMGEELGSRMNALFKEKEKLMAVITSMQEGVVTLDSEGNVTHCNKAAMEMLRLPSEILSKLLLDNVHNDTFISTMKSVQTKKESVQIQFEYHSRTLECRTDLLRAEGGILIVLRDITESAKYESLRKEFVGNVSHELRTPLSIISGFVETLKDGALKDEETAEKFLQKIDKNMKQLSNLVDDLLVLSKLESQVEFANMTGVELPSLIQQCVSDLDTVIQDKGHTVNVKISSSLPVVQADPELLRRALKNLVENAVKYTLAGGSITIRAQQDDKLIIIEVEDAGIGIPEEHFSRLFERFYRVDKSRSREMGGTGLGLSIVKHIAQLHYGNVSVHSQPNEGSTFIFSLPTHKDFNNED